jgi:hypothetical protein
MGRAPCPGAAAPLADLRRLPPRCGPPSNRGSNRTERVLGVRGQPEFAEWQALLGDDSVAIPFLRYLPERLSPRKRSMSARTTTVS